MGFIGWIIVLILALIFVPIIVTKLFGGSKK